MLNFSTLAYLLQKKSSQQNAFPFIRCRLVTEFPKNGRFILNFLIRVSTSIKGQDKILNRDV